MKAAIYATIYHAVSTDTKPQHNKCPPGKESWCFYQSAIAKGRKPGSHAKKIGTPIKEQFLGKILPIYNRLSDEKLLRRCAQCLTQNSNESLHSMIWRKCPKDIFPSKYLIEAAVAEAVTEYNEGWTKTILHAFKDNHMQMSEQSLKIVQNRHKVRVRRYKQKASERYKRARKIIQTHNHQENRHCKKRKVQRTKQERFSYYAKTKNFITRTKMKFSS